MDALIESFHTIAAHSMKNQVFLIILVAWHYHSQYGPHPTIRSRSFSAKKLIENSSRTVEQVPQRPSIIRPAPGRYVNVGIEEGCVLLPV